MGFGYYENLTEREFQRELAALKQTCKEIRRTPASAKAFLIKCGFITKKGKLTKRYGG